LDTVPGTRKEAGTDGTDGRKEVDGGGPGSVGRKEGRRMTQTSDNSHCFDNL